MNRRFVAAYTMAYAGLWAALLPPILLGLQLRARSLDPDHAAASLSLVAGAGALVAMLANPLFGRLSDRTTSRFGMRRPWLILGALGGAAGLAVVAWAQSIGALLLGWCFTQLACNAQLSALAAILSDQVPPQRRGTVSGLVSLSMPVGSIMGTSLARFWADSVAGMFLVPALVAIVTAVWLAWVLPDRVLLRAKTPALRIGEFFMLWVAPLRCPDFAWVWVSRFLLMTSVAVMMTYQVFFLLHQHGRQAAEIPQLILGITLAQSGAVAITSVLSGRLSDVFRRRKIFICAAASIHAVAMLTIALAATYPQFLLGAAVAGAGMGAYFAVDFALAVDVLPNRETHAAANLGIFNIASAMPQSIAPALGSAVLFAGGDYTSLFAIAAVFSVASALTIGRVRAER
ncbi:MAG: MFS transporter [Rudaea sp.]|uniref:MFS transporter n=1 Tax=Rudaea sp. TaxID=2136325 RepID=UPI0039E3A961